MSGFAGVETVIKLDGEGGLVTGTIQDCDPILEYAKARHNEGHHGSSEMRLAASIPFVIVEKYCNDNGVTFAEFMNYEAHKKRLLNDPDLSYFRIWNGRV